MPIDARSLLRATAASSSSSNGRSSDVSSTHSQVASQIIDRFASYHPKTRLLRCTACDYQPVKHESLWASHTASKTHRENVQAIRARQEAKAQKEVEARQAIADDGGETSTSGKRKQADEDGAMKKAKREQESPAMQGSTQIDLEWQRFQDEVLNAQSETSRSVDRHSANAAAATIEVGPVLRQQHAQHIDGMVDQEEEEDGARATESGEADETDEDKRARLEREEREDILARLEEEQRLQEEADERASALRARFEAMRQARAARKKDTV